MAFEVIDHLVATPNRVYAMVKLIEELQDRSPTLDMIYSMLQPDSLQSNEKSAHQACDAQRRCRLKQRAAEEDAGDGN